jgi:hypothetical protein
MPADMIIFNSHYEPVLLVEVMYWPKTSVKRATETREVILERDNLPKARYLLIAAPDRFYLWTDQANSSPSAPPDYVIDPTPILQPYLEKGRITLGKLGLEWFRSIVSSWVGRLTWEFPIPRRLPKGQEWLRESGLLKAVRGGAEAAEVLV